MVPAPSITSNAVILGERGFLQVELEIHFKSYLINDLFKLLQLDICSEHALKFKALCSVVNEVHTKLSP